MIYPEQFLAKANQEKPVVSSPSEVSRQVLPNTEDPEFQEAARKVIDRAKQLPEDSRQKRPEDMIAKYTALIDNYNRMALLISDLKQWAGGEKFSENREFHGINFSLKQQDKIDGLVEEAMQIRPLILNGDEQTREALRHKFERLVYQGEQGLTAEISRHTQLAFDAAKKLAAEKRRLKEIQDTAQEFRRPEDGAVTEAVDGANLPDSK